MFDGFVDGPHDFQSQSAPFQLGFEPSLLGSLSMSRKKSTSKIGSFRRKIFLETLEPRAMLAGNVNVFVSGGSLFVQGDANDNAVLIQQEGNGTYSVTGLDFNTLGVTGLGFAGGPTSINGDDSGEAAIFSGVTNDINVDLKGGNDGLGIGNDIEALDGLARDCFGIGFLPTVTFQNSSPSVCCRTAGSESLAG